MSCKSKKLRRRDYRMNLYHINFKKKNKHKCSINKLNYVIITYTDISYHSELYLLNITNWSLSDNIDFYLKHNYIKLINKKYNISIVLNIKNLVVPLNNIKCNVYNKSTEIYTEDKVYNIMFKTNLKLLEYYFWDYNNTTLLFKHQTDNFQIIVDLCKISDVYKIISTILKHRLKTTEK